MCQLWCYLYSFLIAHVSCQSSNAQPIENASSEHAPRTTKGLADILATHPAMLRLIDDIWNASNYSRVGSLPKVADVIPRLNLTGRQPAKEGHVMDLSGTTSGADLQDLEYGGRDDDVYELKEERQADNQTQTRQPEPTGNNSNTLMPRTPRPYDPNAFYPDMDFLTDEGSLEPKGMTPEMEAYEYFYDYSLDDGQNVTQKKCRRFGLASRAARTARTAGDVFKLAAHCFAMLVYYWLPVESLRNGKPC